MIIVAVKSGDAVVLMNSHGHRLSLSFFWRFLMPKLHQEQKVVDDLQRAADEQRP